MNKKIIIGVVIAGVVIAGGLYVYNKNKKQKQKATDEKQKATDEKQKQVSENNTVTESDAIEIIDLLGKMDGKPFSTEQIKPFLDLYMSNIDKDSHVKIKSILNKKESDWTTQDRLTSVMFIDKVVKPFKLAIQKPKIKR